MTPKLKELIEKLSACRDISSIKSHLSNTDIGASDVADYVRFENGGYSRNRVIKTDRFEVLVLCWKPEQKSKIHNHAGSVCAFKVIKGALKNTNFVQEGGKVFLTSANKLSLSQYIVLSGVDNFHEIANDYAENAVSIHFYSPPIEHYQVADQESDSQLIEEVVL
ncbi:cysteine dioxygenase family protein [Vibrio sp. 404]|uniref:Cysteine dioxygenase family protein n=1 Tax=Vibrio marinisediminis TaxID=2758441 RepID=A0A7W2FRI4_9VIBR|nr:cysteine dioxygenase family protein [Vibrio marinisediminis]MBA5762959.1 cysteine dioxygenase family protein [Vibrio marinisediminis]